MEALGASLICQGAEARLYKHQFCGRASVVKERFVKKYRHPVLDKKISHRRMQQELRSLIRCRKQGIATPSVYFVDLLNRRIWFEYIHGTTLKEHLLKEDASDNIAREVGKTVALMHNASVIHGDLTTSNILLRKPEENTDSPELVVIDFGLSFHSDLVEDKAVDLYVLERAFIAAHPNSEEIFHGVLTSYKLHAHGGKGIINRLDQVRLRGRKKIAFG